jgi:hypothetical protein
MCSKYLSFNSVHSRTGLIDVSLSRRPCQTHKPLGPRQGVTSSILPARFECEDSSRRILYAANATIIASLLLAVLPSFIRPPFASYYTTVLLPPKPIITRKSLTFLRSFALHLLLSTVLCSTMSSMLIQNIQKGRVTSLALDETLSNPQELATTHFSCLLAALEQQQQYTNTKTSKNNRNNNRRYCSNSNTGGGSIVRGIESVELSDHFLKSLVSTSSLTVLLMYISKLPNLRKLRIYSVYTAWPVMIWSRVLQTATKLESWHVTRGIRLNSQDDIVVLSDCLKNHPSLVEVSLLDLGDVDGLLKNASIQQHNRNRNESFADTDTEEENDIHPEATTSATIISTETPRQNEDDDITEDAASTPKMTLDPLVLALSTIPNLETVDITVAPEFAPKLGRLSDSSFNSLFSNLQSLQDVSLWEFGLDNGHMVVLKQAVQSHRRLQFLSLRRNAAITSVGWKTVSDMMEQNTTLVSLYYDSASAITTVDSEEYKCLSDHHDRIRLFLWLNQLGRGGLFDSITKRSVPQQDHAVTTVARAPLVYHPPNRLNSTSNFLSSTVRQCDDWPAFLDRVSGDPDALFYLLQAHPQLGVGRPGPV